MHSFLMSWFCTTKANKGPEFCAWCRVWRLIVYACVCIKHFLWNSAGNYCQINIQADYALCVGLGWRPQIAPDAVNLKCVFKLLVIEEGRARRRRCRRYDMDSTGTWTCCCPLEASLAWIKQKNTLQFRASSQRWCGVQVHEGQELNNAEGTTEHTSSVHTNSWVKVINVPQ